VVVALVAPACGDDSSGDRGLSDTAALGEALATQFIDLLRTGDRAGLDDFLSPGFLLVRSDGTTLDKRAYLANPAVVNAATVSEVTAVPSGDVLVVRWTLVVDELINGAQVSTAPAPRLSVFRYENQGWRLLSHANFAKLTR
jgi:hypothetical protein